MTGVETGIVENHGMSAGGETSVWRTITVRGGVRAEGNQERTSGMRSIVMKGEGRGVVEMRIGDDGMRPK